MSLKERIKINISEFINNNKSQELELEKELEIKKIVSYLIVFATTVLTVMNLLNQYYLMAISTGIMSVSFLICVSLCSDKENIRIINIIMMIVVIVVFSYYAISGQNEGFAILWISLVPITSIIAIGIKEGTVLSIYFQILLIIIFYTPIGQHISLNYSQTFRIRYPILYSVSFALSIYVTIRNENYKNEIKEALKVDKLTGLLNREAYDECIKDIKVDNLSLFLVKANGLYDVNNKYGHEAGNKLIKYSADYIRSVFKDKYNVYKISGSMFAIITYEKATELPKIEKEISNFTFKYKKEKMMDVKLIIGYASIEDEKINTYSDLENLALTRMNKKKKTKVIVSKQANNTKRKI